eukprot:gene5939-8187_t
MSRPSSRLESQTGHSNFSSTNGIGQTISPYSRPLTTSSVIDKSTIIWKDFLNGVRKRKALIKRLNEAASKPTNATNMLKRLLLDIRQTTLRLIEDALEIEYRTKLYDREGLHDGKSLPPISSFKRFEDKEDIYALTEMITDVDELFKIPNIRAMLPIEFPETRNTFMLGKDIDELSTIIPPHPEAGNLEEELKVLELLRYKRTSVALLRAEAQTLNNLPIALYDLDKLLILMKEDDNVDRLIRSVCTILDNEHSSVADEPNFYCLMNESLHIESHDFMLRLNKFRGAVPTRIDVQSAVIQALNQCNFEYLENPIVNFLIDWLNLVLNKSISKTANSNTNYNNNMSMKTTRVNTAYLSNSQSNPRTNGLNQISLGSINEQLIKKSKSQLKYDLYNNSFNESKNNSHDRMTFEDLTSHGGGGAFEMPHEEAPMMKRAAQYKISSNPTSPTNQQKQPNQNNVQINTELKPHKTEKSKRPTSGNFMKPKGRRSADLANKLKTQQLRQEVQDIIKELGLSTTNNNSNIKVNRSVDENDQFPDTLSSMRYELFKMQQELLRRQILDPRHYNVNSVDITSFENRGLTVVKEQDHNNIDNYHHQANNKQSSVSHDELVIQKEIELDVFGPGNIQLFIDNQHHCLLVRINKLKTEEFIDFSGVIRKKVHVITTAFMYISNLIFNRATDYLYEGLLNAPSDENKKFMLSKIMDILLQQAVSKPPPKGRLYLTIDRTLFTNRFAEDGVLVDLVISRNDDCDGLTITCTPIAGLLIGQVNAGAITLNVQDNELQILLINQHGLFALSKTKWTSMELVAKWLASRLRIARIRTQELIQNDGVDEENDEMMVVEDDEKSSVASELTHESKRSTSKLDPIDSFAKSLTKAHHRKTPQKSTLNLFSNAFSTTKTLMMMDVSIDRRVEISKSVQSQWKSRNVSSIQGMQIIIKAWQELEMLHIVVKLILPPPEYDDPDNLYISKGSSVKSGKSAKGEKGGGVLAASKSQDNQLKASNEEDDDSVKEEKKTVELMLSYKLTGAELMVFGSCDVPEKKKVALLNSKPNDNHPESFIWNIFNRLQIFFKGSKSAPFKDECSANYIHNWELKYNRKIAREVRTISRGVMVITVSTIGSELLFEAEAVDESMFRNIGSKVFTELELIDIIKSEGFPMKLAEYQHRRELSILLLDKLKVVSDTYTSLHRLEMYNFSETGLLKIAVVNSASEAPVTLGSVEISSHFTLSDLRILIREELDSDDLPKNFRFFYKASSCAIRQEPFRRAWELMPKCLIIKKIPGENSTGSDQNEALNAMLMKNVKDSKVQAMNEQAGISGSLLKKGQRRVAARLVPIPVPTLCCVQENSSEVYLLHNARDLFTVGDVIRIGNILGRDYIVVPIGNDFQSAYPNTIKIDPVYDLLEEPDFDAPFQGNYLYPSSSIVGKYNNKMILKNNVDFGYRYAIPDREEIMRLEHTEPDITQSISNNESDSIDIDGNGNGINDINQFNKSSDALKQSQTNNNVTKKKKKKISNQIFLDCWIWKCIPEKEDKRSQWRKLYDDGLVPYVYQFMNSKECFESFHCKAYYSLMEVLCTDTRCSTLSEYAQRVDEMPFIPIEEYTQFMFNSLKDWTPKSTKGIDRTKFIKMIRGANAFLDLKRPARIAQIEMLFQREVKGENGISQKYLNYYGFCKVIQDLALLRYPTRKKKQESEVKTALMNFDETAAANNGVGPAAVGGGGNASDNDDDGSVASFGSLGGGSASIASIGEGSIKTKNKNNNNNPKKSNNILNRNDPKSLALKESALKAIEESNDDVDSEYLQFVFEKFITHQLMSYSDWYDAIWMKAKLLAMKKESIRYCAATRIMTFFRRFIHQKKYQFFRYYLIIFQANIRRKLSAMKTQAYINKLLEDYYYRYRYYCAMKIQSIGRRYIKRCWYYWVLDKLKKEQVIIQKVRRLKLKKLKQASKKAVVYKEAKRINGVLVFIKISRKDTRNYSRDYGIMIEVYTPHNQTTYQFPIEEVDLRIYMTKIIEKDGLSVGDILDIRNLKRVVSAHLIVFKPTNKKSNGNVIFSKHGVGERGEKVFVRGKKIQNEYFICKIYQTGDDLSVHSYHRISCKLFKCNISMIALKEWIIEENKMILHENELDSHMMPRLLRTEHRSELYTWLLQHLSIDRRKGQFKVLFSNQLHKSQKKEKIIKIQSVWRRALTRPIIIKMLDEIMLKVHISAYDHTPYYINKHTGASSWVKPFLLGPYDLPTIPTRRWVRVNYYSKHAKTNEESYAVHYVNPYSGKYTSYTPDNAAKVIQKLVRKFLLKPISMPFHLFIKAGMIIKNAEKNYQSKPNKLAPVINYAIVNHAVFLEELTAKKTYVEAVELSEANPLVTRSYAFFMLGTIESPMILNRERAQVLLSDAKRRDESMTSFETAYQIFRFGLLKQPNDTRALLNLALIQTLLYDENYNAEKLLRRALAIAPFDERVVEVWKYLKERFPERQLMYNPMSRVSIINSHKGNKKRVIHGRPVIEDSLWAGWVYCDMDEFGVSKIFKKGEAYWYNPADGTEQVNAPNFKEQWDVRRNRSQFMEEKHGLEHYYDPLTATHFQYHLLTDSYQ